MYAIAEVGSPVGVGVEELRRRIIGGAADVAAFQARWFEWVGEFDALEGWAVDGLASLGAWLGLYCGLDGRTARQHAQVARALRSLPMVREAFGSGRLSYSKVRALCRVAGADNEAQLVELALTTTAAQLGRVVGLLARLRERALTPGDERERRARCGVSTWVDEHGLHHTEIVSAPEDGRIIEAAIDYRRRQLWKEERKATAGVLGRLESLVLVLKRGLINAERGDVDGGLHLLITHVPDATMFLRDDGQVDLGDGAVVHPRVLQRLGCEALLQTMIVDEATGRPLDLGRLVRTATINQKKAAMLRYPACVWHGCGIRSKDCEFHHLDWWSKGGASDLDNFRPLCARHHRMVHDGGWRAVLGVGGQLVLIPPGGRPALHAVPDVRPSDGSEVEAANRAAGRTPAPSAPDTIRGWAAGERMTDRALGVYLEGLVRIDERVAQRREASPN